MTEGIKRPFLIRIPALYNPDTSMTIEAIYALQKPWRDNIHEAIRKMQPRQKNLEEIAAEKYQAHLEKIRGMLFPHTKKVLATLIANPRLAKTQLKAEVGGTKIQFEKSIETLLKMKLIETKECTLKTRPGTYYPTNNKAHDLMDSTAEERKNCKDYEHFEHDLDCDAIKEHLQSFGLNPIREFTIKGSKKSIDVAVNAKRGGKDHWLAIEAMITDLYYMDETLKKCLNHMMMDEVIIVTKNADDRDKAKDQVKDTDAITAGQKEKVRCMSIKEFLTNDPTA